MTNDVSTIQLNPLCSKEPLVESYVIITVAISQYDHEVALQHSDPRTRMCHAPLAAETTSVSVGSGKSSIMSVVYWKLHR